MSLILSVLYFSIVILGIVYYLIKRERRLSLSDFVMLVNTVLFSFSGIANSYGWVEGYDSFDFTLYILYLANAIIIPFGLVVGKRIKIRNKYRAYQRGVSDSLLFGIAVFVIIYAIGYFYIIKDNIPLIMLISGKGVYAVSVARLQVTHNFDQYYSVPFIYRYRSLVFSFVALYTFSLLYVKYLYNKHKYRLIFWPYFAFIVFLQFYATEKVPLIYLLIIIVVDYYSVRLKSRIRSFLNDYADEKDLTVKRKTRRRIFFLSVMGFGLFVVLYTVFMGQETYYLGIESMLRRAFIQQSSSVYLQKIILDTMYNGCLYGKGLTLTLVDSLIGRTPINLSRRAYETQYSYYLKDGGAGSAGSIGIFDLYANVGLVLAIILLVGIVVVTAIIDKKMNWSIEESESKELPIAYYSMITYIFFQGYLGHFQTFFQFPFIVAPDVFIIMLMTYFFRSMIIRSKS